MPRNKKEQHINTSRYHVTGDTAIKYKIEFEGELDFNKNLMDSNESSHYYNVSWAEDTLRFDNSIDSIKGLILRMVSKEVFDNTKLFDRAIVTSCVIKNPQIEISFNNFLKDFNNLNKEKQNEELLAAKKEAKMLADKIKAMEASLK